MAKDALLQVRMDPEMKRAAEALYASMGTTLSEAVRLFAAQSIAEGGLPFTPASMHGKGTGRAFGSLHVFASPAKRAQERETWVSSLLPRAERQQFE